MANCGCWTSYQVKAFARAATLYAASLLPPSTPTKVLEDILLKLFTSTTSNGKTVISTAEAGGSVTFSFIGDMTPDQIMGIAMAALDWLNQQPTPDQPDFTARTVRRLRPTFHRAWI